MREVLVEMKMTWKKFFFWLGVNFAVSVLLEGAIYFFCKPGHQAKSLSNMLMTFSESVDTFLVMYFVLSRVQLKKSK